MSKPKTAEQWLEQDDLPTELGRVFTPEEEWKHNLNLRGSYDLTHWCCGKCKHNFSMADVASASYTPDNYDWCKNATKSSCPVPDPITIDWNTTEAERAKLLWTCVEPENRHNVGYWIHDKLTNAMRDVYETKTRDYQKSFPDDWWVRMYRWWALFATASDLLIAAAMAAERKEVKHE